MYSVHGTPVLPGNVNKRHVGTAVTSNVVDPDPLGSAFILLSCIRIRTGNADPDPGAKKFTNIYQQT